MHFLAKQKFSLYAAGLMVLCGVSYVGLRSQKPDASLSVTPISGDAPPVQNSPDSVEVPTPTPDGSSEPESKEVVVAMAGAVKTPGLLHLSSGARVDDAIKRAGGAKPDADLESINLAAKAVDGDQIYVPYKKAEPEAKATETEKVVSHYRGGTVSAHYVPLAPSMPPSLEGTVGGTLEVRPTSPSHDITKPKTTGPVSLSTANLAQLETLPGVGPATAQKIIDYRMEHGGFSSVEEIQAVKGIGPKKFEKMKPFLQL